MPKMKTQWYSGFFFSVLNQLFLYFDDDK